MEIVASDFYHCNSQSLSVWQQFPLTELLIPATPPFTAMVRTRWFKMCALEGNGHSSLCYRSF